MHCFVDSDDQCNGFFQITVGFLMCGMKNILSYKIQAQNYFLYCSKDLSRNLKVRVDKISKEFRIVNFCCFSFVESKYYNQVYNLDTFTLLCLVPLRFQYIIIPRVRVCPNSSQLAEFERCWKIQLRET